MAKSKRSAALFEVINRSRPVPRPVRQGLLSSMGTWLRPGKDSDVGGSTVPMMSIDAVSSPPPVVMAPAMSSRSRADSSGPVSIDADRGEVMFRLSYTSAAILMFASMTAIGAAFLAGRKAQWPDSSGMIAAVDSRLGPAQPSVVNLEKTPVELSNTTRADVSALQSVQGQQLNSNTRSVPPAAPGPRKAGLNYVVINTYPEEMAKNVKKVLAENGIDSTLEQLPEYGRKKGWYTIVGTVGFERISRNPSFEAYKKKLEAISDRHYKRMKFYAFDPQAYMWK